MTDKKSLTATNIRYLLAMMRLNSKGKGVRGVEIASAMKITKPSVHTMMNTLSGLKLIRKDPYGAAFFTDEGLKLAKMYDEYYQVLYRALADEFNDVNIESAICAFMAELSQESLERFCAEHKSDKINL